MTGASSGLGRAAAIRLAAADASIALLSRSAGDLAGVQETIASGGGTARSLPADLADPAAIEAAVQHAVQEFGRRLARWYGQVSGDLRPGGEFRLFIESDDWDGTGRVAACEAPRRLAVTTRETDESWRKGRGAPPYDETIEATLTADGGQTILVIEVRGMPLDKIAFYGAGWQIHAETLATYLAGRARGDTEARWDDLVPPYQDLAANLG